MATKSTSTKAISQPSTKAAAAESTETNGQTIRATPSIVEIYFVWNTRETLQQTDLLISLGYLQFAIQQKLSQYHITSTFTRTTPEKNTNGFWQGRLLINIADSRNTQVVEFSAEEVIQLEGRRIAPLDWPGLITPDPVQFSSAENSNVVSPTPLDLVFHLVWQSQSALEQSDIDVSIGYITASIFHRVGGIYIKASIDHEQPSKNEEGLWHSRLVIHVQNTTDLGIVGSFARQVVLAERFRHEPAGGWPNLITPDPVQIVRSDGSRHV